MATVNPTAPTVVQQPGVQQPAVQQQQAPAKVETPVATQSTLQSAQSAPAKTEEQSFFGKLVGYVMFPVTKAWNALVYVVSSVFPCFFSKAEEKTEDANKPTAKVETPVAPVAQQPAPAPAQQPTPAPAQQPAPAKQ